MGVSMLSCLGTGEVEGQDKWCEDGRHHVHVMTIGVLKSFKTYLQLHRRHFTINSFFKHPEQVQEKNKMSMMRSSMMRSSRISISRPLRPATCKSRMGSSLTQLEQALTNFQSCAAMTTRRTWTRQQDRPAPAQHPTSATPSAQVQRPTTSTNREPPMPVLGRPTQPVSRHQSATPQDQLLRAEGRTAVCRRLSSKTRMHLRLRRRRTSRRWDRSPLTLLISRRACLDLNDDEHVCIISSV